MISPVFENIGNTEAAEILSEIFEPASYKCLAPYGEGRNDDVDAPFPPEPTHLAAITYAYTEPNPRGVGVRRQFLALHKPPVGPTLDELVNLYDNTVGEQQDQFGDMMQVTAEIVPEFRTVDAIQDWCVYRVLKDQKRLVVAHIVGRVASDNTLIDTLAYNKGVLDDMGLMVRDGLIRGMGICQEVAKRTNDTEVAEVLELFKESAGPVLRGEMTAKKYGLVALTSFLPTPQQARVLLTRTYP